MRLVARLLPALLLAAATACDDDNVVEPGKFATVRVVNVTGVDTLGLVREGLTVPAVWARFRTTSDCIVVPAGQQTLRFRQIRATADLTTIEENLEQGGRYTIVVSGTGATKTTTVLLDEPTAFDTATSNLVRFINATASPGDVYANPPGAAVGTPVVDNLPVFTATTAPTWVTLPRANTQIRLFDDGVTTGTPRATLTLAVPATRVTTIVFMDAGTPAGATSVRVDRCT